MSDLPDGSHIVPRRLFEESISKGTTRLVRRALSSLKEDRLIDLPILDIVASESSLFVMSEEWDTNARDPDRRNFDRFLYSKYDGRFDDVLLPSGEELSREEYTKSGRRFPDFNAGRLVVVHEFSFEGEFMHRIELPLVLLDETGRDRIRNRVPGRPIIVGEHIHFHERFRIMGYSRIVRVDYLFTTKGDRLAVWSNETFFDVYSEPDELVVPSETIIKPQWLVNGQLIAIQPEGYKLSRNDLMNDMSYHGHISEESSNDQYLHVVAVSSIELLISDASHPEIIPRSRAHDLSLLRNTGLKLYGADFPVPSEFVAHKTYKLGWEEDASDSHCVWFFGSNCGQNIIWRIAIDPKPEQPEEFRLPLPVREIWFNSNHISENWVPLFQSAYKDYLLLGSDVCDAYSAHGASNLDIQQRQFLAWGDHFIIEWDVWYEHEVVHSVNVLYRIVGGELAVIGDIPIGKKAGASIRRSITNHYGNQSITNIQLSFLPTEDHIGMVPRQLIGEKLVSLGYNPLAPSEPAKWVLVSNIETGSEDWFVPRVAEPAANMEYGKDPGLGE